MAPEAPTHFADDRYPSCGAAMSDASDVDRLGHQLVRLLRLVERTQAHLASAHGVERATYMLLARLVKGGPQRLSLLAENVHSAPSTVSRQVGYLVRNGLVERRTDPDDGRACVLAPTEAGTATFQRHRGQRNEHLARMLADWSADDRHRLVDLLDRFNTEFENCPPVDLARTSGTVRTERETR